MDPKVPRGPHLIQHIPNQSLRARTSFRIPFIGLQWLLQYPSSLMQLSSPTGKVTFPSSLPLPPLLLKIFAPPLPQTPFLCLRYSIGSARLLNHHHGTLSIGFQDRVVGRGSTDSSGVRKSRFKTGGSARVPTASSLSKNNNH